jgi:hypothetical protein
MLVPAVEWVMPRLLTEAALLLKVLLDALLLLRRVGEPNTSRFEMPALEMLELAPLEPKRSERPKFSSPAAALARWRKPDPEGVPGWLCARAWTRLP